MTDEIEVVRDDEGVAIIGDPSAVERFLSSNGLASRELTLPRWSEVSSSGSMAAQAGAGLAASGRWVKLTKDSAKALKDFPAMKGSNPSVSRAVVTDGGKIKGILQFVKTPGSVLTNPAILTGAAGVMAQLAMQQAMDEITDYLAKIDAKLDDVLRAQKDQVFSDMIGVDLLLSEALTIREQVGGVNDVTWSKVQGASQTILTVQSYALRALDALAVKLEKTTKVGDLAELTSDAESAARLVGALLALGAVTWAVSAQFGGSAPVLLMILPFIAGLGTGWQQAVNGQVRLVAGSALSATFINFAVGTVVLLVLMLGHWALAGLPKQLPTEPWLYVGGAIGCVFIGVTALLVRITGVLLLGLATVAGQLMAALLLDLLLPTSSHALAFSTIGGTLLAIVAVAVASIRWGRRRRPA